MTLTELVEKRNTLREELTTVNAQIVEHVEMQRRMLDGVVAEIEGAGVRRRGRARGSITSAETRAKLAAAKSAWWAERKAANGSDQTLHQ